VSAPLVWDEVADVEPDRFTVETMRDRIASLGDPMAGMWRRKPSLLSRFSKLGLEPP
jgi:DNA primase